MSDLKKAIHNLQARAAVSELRALYTWHAARGDGAAVADLFTEDCLFDSPAGPGKRAVTHGRAALKAFFGQAVNVKGAILPLIHNEITEVDGDEAWGSSVFESPLVPRFGHSVSQYIERFRRVDGKWYFSERRMYTMMPYWEDHPSELPVSR